MEALVRKLAVFAILSIALPIESAVFDIKIGAIFHKGDEHLEAAFDDALRDLGAEEKFPFHLVPIKRKNVELESFRASNVACDLLQEGIAALFGPSNFMTRNTIAGVAARFDIPYFEYSYRRTDDSPPYKGINVYPNARDLERAIAEVVKNMKYQGFTYIYQGHDALSRIQAAMERPGQRSEYTITIRELPVLKDLKQMSEREQNIVYERLVKEIKESTQLSLLLDVETENLSTLLDKMNQMDLIGDYFMCLISNLDAPTVDISEFIPKNSIANMTYFEFFNDSRTTRKYLTEQALIYDAVFVFAEAFNNLYKEIDSQDDAISKLTPKGLSCFGQVKYDLGWNLTDMVIRKTKTGRLTGHMTFNENKERDFHIDVVNLQARVKTVSGQWRDGKLNMIVDEKVSNTTLSEAAKGKILKVTTRNGPPYIMPSEDESSGRLIGNKKYEGYCIDLIEKIGEYLGINFEFQLVPGNGYGARDPRTKKWNGLIKELLDRKADLAICDLTITSERQSAVDFTAPFMNLGISILFTKPEKVQTEIFSFMEPLTEDVWMYIATAFLVVVLILFVQTRIAPGEWINPHPCKDDPDELENTFNLENSMWLTMGSLMQQGSDILPRTISVRVLTLTWWFFVLIMVSSYTANLAAFLTAVKMENSIDGVDDLPKQTKIAYGAVKDGSTYSFFKKSNITLYQRIFNAMDDKNPTVYTQSNSEGVERVLKTKRKYAFFMESTSIEYEIERHCELQQVGTLLDSKGYGIALPPNSPYRTLISTAILHLQEKGELQALKNKWWKEKGGGQCNDVDEPENSNELGVPQVVGVFIVLYLGCLLSFLIGLIQFIWNAKKVAVDEKISYCEAFVREMKFFISFKTNTKPARRSRSKSTSVQGSNNSAPNSLKRFN